jgi:hypothetical protein
MSDMAVVQRNYTNIRERTRLYYGKKWGLFGHKEVMNIRIFVSNVSLTFNCLNADILVSFFNGLLCY